MLKATAGTRVLVTWRRSPDGALLTARHTLHRPASWDVGTVRSMAATEHVTGLFIDQVPAVGLPDRRVERRTPTQSRSQRTVRPHRDHSPHQRRSDRAPGDL